MNNEKYLFIRILKAIMTIWFVWTLVFCLTRLTGDPVEWILDASGSVEAKEQLRHNLGLDLPLWEQYLNGMKGLFTGDNGNSYYYARPVSDLFAERLGATAKLGLATLIVTIIGGSVVVETVFAWPGIGTLIVTAAQQRDFPVVQYGVLLISICVTFINLAVDISYGLLDPRIRDSY